MASADDVDGYLKLCGYSVEGGYVRVSDDHQLSPLQELNWRG